MQFMETLCIILRYVKKGNNLNTFFIKLICTGIFKIHKKYSCKINLW